MRERIDITEVEDETKIRAKYLRAIENEEWDLLPGPVYAKSFLRTYGNYLGLDSQMLVEEFRRRHEVPSEHELRPVNARSPRDRDLQPRQARVPSWTPIVLAVLAVLAILYVVGSLPGSGTTNNGAQRSLTPHHRVRHAVPRAKAKPAAPRSVRLQMVATNPVYLCLVNGAGTKLINEQTFTAGQTIPAQSGSRLLLTLGNNNLRLRVNGKVVPLAPSPSAIRLLITPTQIQHITLAQRPTCP